MRQRERKGRAAAEARSQTPDGREAGLQINPLLWSEPEASERQNQHAILNKSYVLLVMSVNTIILLARKLLGKSSNDRHRRCTPVSNVMVGQRGQSGYCG